MTGSDDSGADSECANCGESIGAVKGVKSWCSIECYHADQTESVPIAELEALADKWWNKYDKEPAEIVNENHQVRALIYNSCAAELRSLIAEYRGETDG